LGHALLDISEKEVAPLKPKMKDEQSRNTRSNDLPDKMKLKIVIAGPKVHDVGYRPWLVELAISMGLRGFDVYNDEEDGHQTVIALLEADDRRIQKFLDIVNTKRPQLAKVNNVMSEDYIGEIMPLWQTAAMNAYGQMNKAVPILQSMNEKIGSIDEKIGSIDEKIGSIDEKIGSIDEKIGSMNGTLQEMKSDIKTIKKNTDPIPQILEELQPGYAMQFRQVQADIKAIKDRLGMP